MQPRRLAFRYAVLLAIIFVASLRAFATVTLAWDASGDPNVVGYYIYWGPGAGIYTNRIDAGTNLSIRVPIVSPGTYYFSATSRNAEGVESEFSRFVSIGVPTITPPTTLTTWPKANNTIPNGQKCVNGPSVTTAPEIPFSGAVTDDGAVTAVTVTRVVPSWAPLTFSPTLTGPNNSKTWTNVVSLVNGSNTFRIVAVDSAGLTTTLLRTIFLRTTTQLTLITNGYGSTAPVGVLAFGSARNGALLQIGRNYSIRAAAKPGNWFVNWTDGSGTVIGTNPTVTFQMTNGLVLNANFETNAIVAYHLAGAYSGLFAEEAGVSPLSAGSISGLTINTARTFSGRLFAGGASYPVSGSFDSSGSASKTIVRKSKSSLVLAMQLDFSSGAKQITGIVSCPGEGWTSQLRANQSAFSASNPSPMAGRYTMAIPPSDAIRSDYPIGYGYGLITNKPTGTVTLTGALADLTTINCTAPLAQNGDWPVCVDLYAHQGLLFGWLNLASGAPVGRLAWLKPAQPPATNMLSKMFPAGLNNAIDVIGSVYRPSLPAVALASNSLELDLAPSSSATYAVAFNNNAITSSAHITGSVVTTTGLIKLTLPSTITGGATRTAYAVALQSSNAAVGTVSGINAAVFLH